MHSHFFIVVVVLSTLYGLAWHNPPPRQPASMEPQDLIARRIARELRSGMLVNLGIGIPTLVANFVPPEVHVFFQSENGLLGTGPVPEAGMELEVLTDAAGQPVTALPGACAFDSATSFGLISRRPS